MISDTLTGLLYLAASICFIFSLKGLASPETAQRGNKMGMLGMGIAIITTLLGAQVVSYSLIIGGILVGGTIGTLIAKRIQMTNLPQLMAGFHSLVGLAAVFVAAAAFYAPSTYNIGVKGHIFKGSLLEMSLGLAIGAVTFTGSLVAYGKLQGLIKGALQFDNQHKLNAILGLVLAALIALFVLHEHALWFWMIVVVSLVLGYLLIMPIGGADMPVVVSMLNSYSGWAACGIGFTLHNTLLIITGALVGSSGAILSYIMCKGMNRSILNVILGGFGTDISSSATSTDAQKPVKAGSADDAAFMLKNASSVIIVPGYGMAVAQAQHVLREMVDTLKKNGVTVRYAIHPVAGRMPGHMNVLLAEAQVPYDDVFELDEINRDFGSTDVAFVIGANDITNPAAKTDTQSPIYGMPILDVEKAKTVLFVKRSLASGYAGVDNSLFYKDNTMMLFGDAKKVCEEIIAAVE
jgi:H+-translocating NAD(P) transhydrogenase subunit beta